MAIHEIIDLLKSVTVTDSESNYGMNREKIASLEILSVAVVNFPRYILSVEREFDRLQVFPEFSSTSLLKTYLVAMFKGTPWEEYELVELPYEDLNELSEDWELVGLNGYARFKENEGIIEYSIDEI